MRKINYVKTLQNMTKEDKEILFKGLRKKEGKVKEVKDLGILLYIRDAFLELENGNVEGAAHMIGGEVSFPEDKNNLTKKVFDTVMLKYLTNKIVRN